MATERVPHLSAATQLAELASRAQSLTGASGAAIALDAGENMVTVASSGSSAPDVGVPVRRDGSFAGLCAQSGVMQVCDDTETDSRVDAGACRSLNIRSMVAMPVKEDGKTVGVLAAFAAEPQWFISSKLSLMTVLADIIAELVKRDSGSSAAPNDTLKPAVGPLPVEPDATLEVPELLRGFGGPQAASAESSPLDLEPLPDALAEIAALAEVNFDALVDKAQSSSTTVHYPPIEKEAAPKPVAPILPTRSTASVAEAKQSAPPAPAATVRRSEAKQSAPVPKAAAVSPSELKPSASPRKAAAELLPVASDPCAEGTMVASLVKDDVPVFASFQSEVTRRTGVPKFVYVAAAVVVLALATWMLRGTMAKAAKPNPAPAAAAAVAPTPSEPTVAAAQPAPASIPAKDTKPAAESEASAKKSETKESKAAGAESKPALVLKPGAARPRNEEADAAPPTVLLADAKTPILMAVSKPYIPSAPQAKTAQVVPPQLIKKVPPVFPELAKRYKYSSTVVLNARINRDGSMGEIQVVRGMSVFHRAAIDAVKQWRYKPAYLDGAPVESTVDIELQFKEQN